MKGQQIRERVQTHRNRMREAGFKTIQLWLPDPEAPGFPEECRRQSLVIRKGATELQELEMLAQIADWGEE